MASFFSVRRPSDFRGFDDQCRETATRWNTGIDGSVERPPMRPWNSCSPRALGCTMFKVLSEFVEHLHTAVCNINKFVWDTDTFDQPTWMRAHNTVCTMAYTGIGPAVQHMDDFNHLLMATLGAREGTYLGQAITAYQVREALNNRSLQTDIQASPAINAIVEFLNATAGKLLHFCNVGCEYVGNSSMCYAR